MAFASMDTQRSASPMAEINMVPLIDVMLVLLVIFIVTAPMLTQAVKLKLPEASAAPLEPTPDPVRLAITENGAVYWNEELLPAEVLSQRWVEAGQRQPRPALHLSADRAVPFGIVDEVLAEATRAGLTQVSVLSTPKPAAAPLR